MNRIAPTGAAALALLSGMTMISLSNASSPAAADPAARPSPTGQDWDRTAYRGEVEVVPAEDGTAADTVTGVVFDDRDRDSRSDRRERGIPGVVVSNGREVTRTDRAGRYELPAYDGMTVFVTQPAGYQVPVDDDNVAQFHYHHLPEGSPELRYGGLAPTGPLPEEVNFGMVRSEATASSRQSCVIAGDLQPYNVEEVDYARNGAIADLAARNDYTGCGPLFIGDVVGDDLSLYDDVRDLVSEVNGPVRFLPGNHDLDFDAPTAENSFDTFKAQLAPEYFSYDVGQAHVLALNTVRYPCTPDVDNADGQHPECNNPAENPRYNGRLSETQLEWLAADLAATPRNKLVIVASHIPLLTYADEGSRIHQVDQLLEVHELLEGRRALAIAGHTHSIENMKTGDLFKGWKDIFGIDGLPFPHMVAGAISGDWYSGRVTEEGYPTALGRDGGRPGLTTLDLFGNTFKERYTVTGESGRVQTQLGLNTPSFREWMVARQQWNRGDRTTPAPELGDTSVVTAEDLAGGTWVTTNFWMGATDSTVKVSVDGARPAEAVRTQEARGEDQLIGPEYADPYAVAEQLVHGGSVADRTMHLWRFDLPRDLAPGEHEVKVWATDSYGRTFTDAMTFEVAEQR